MICFLDIFVFTICAINVGYLLFFVVGALFYRESRRCSDDTKHLKIVALVPAYKEDAVVVECVESCLAQSYDKSLYDVVIISDKMEVQTNTMLEQMGAKVIVANYTDSTKAKALNLAFSSLPDGIYDVALILDADNVIPHDYLERLNEVFKGGDNNAYQTHRVAKNLDSNLAYLDAVSEEINNTIFRKGHTAVGLSSALIGSGMAFDYSTIKRHLGHIKAIGGFDRELEFKLFKEGLKIGYIDDLLVYDEKISSYKGFSNQRRRWMSAQFHYLKTFIVYFPKEISRGNLDFCDKFMQHLFIPRLLLLGLVVALTIIATFIDSDISIKWWYLCVLLFGILLLAIPRKLYTLRLLQALFALPRTFIIVFLNLFKLKGANKHFIHTPHGGGSK